MSTFFYFDGSRRIFAKLHYICFSKCIEDHLLQVQIQYKNGIQRNY